MQIRTEKGDEELYQRFRVSLIEQGLKNHKVLTDLLELYIEARKNNKSIDDLKRFVHDG